MFVLRQLENEKETERQLYEKVGWVKVEVDKL